MVTWPDFVKGKSVIGDAPMMMAMGMVVAALVGVRIRLGTLKLRWPLVGGCE